MEKSGSFAARHLLLPDSHRIPVTRFATSTSRDSMTSRHASELYSSARQGKNPFMMTLGVDASEIYHNCLLNAVKISSQSRQSLAALFYPPLLMSLVGRLQLYAVAGVVGPLSASKQLFTGCDF
jgi:hypothetical protein